MASGDFSLTLAHAAEVLAVPYAALQRACAELGCGRARGGAFWVRASELERLERHLAGRVDAADYADWLTWDAFARALGYSCPNVARVSLGPRVLSRVRRVTTLSGDTLYNPSDALHLARERQTKSGPGAARMRKSA